ncbi:MAG: type II toxin-antitoxin system RelE/ParE family toxin [Lachnospiraceae bacterium]
MLDLQYSKVVQQKLMELKTHLVQISGEKRGTKQLHELVAAIENLAMFPQTGIPISILHDVEPEFQKYYVLIRPRNYVIYYIEDQNVIVAELYDYREDYANQFFHVRTTNNEEDRFWGE